MPKTTVQLANGFYESESLPLANQRCVNLYPNIPQAVAMTEGSLFAVQGLEELTSTSRKASDGNRGGWVFNGVPFVINGHTLFQIRRTVGFGDVISYSTLAIGTIDGNGACSFADNGKQMVIVNDLGEGYIHEPAAVPQFSIIEDSGFYANGTPEQIVFIDSYFVVTTSDKKAIVSAVNDGTDWNALDSFTAESDPDKIVAPFVLRNQLYLLGSQTAETYQNIGGAGVPFQRVNGFVLSQGCSAPFSVVKLGDNVLWVGAGENEQSSIWMYDGGATPQKVSTTAVDVKIQSLTPTQLEGMYSWAYSIRGNQFAAFTSNEFTLVFDLSTGKWHERESSITNTRGVRSQARTRIRCVLSAYNELIVGDTEDGRIGKISSDISKEYDSPLFCYFTTSPLYQMGEVFTLPEIELNCEVGVGNKEIPDPEVRMEISRNGRTFENPRTRHLGKIGEYDRRVMWYLNGRVTKFCIFRITVSDPVERRFYELIIKYKQGKNRG